MGLHRVIARDRIDRRDDFDQAPHVRVVVRANPRFLALIRHRRVPWWPDTARSVRKYAPGYAHVRHLTMQEQIRAFGVGPGRIARILASMEPSSSFFQQVESICRRKGERRKEGGASERSKNEGWERESEREGRV
eukprot:1553201-Rhodomonas_salina.1